MNIWRLVFLKLGLRNVAAVKSDNYMVIISNNYVAVISGKYVAVISDKYVAVISILPSHRVFCLLRQGEWIKRKC